MELKRDETIKITLDDQYMEKCDEKILWLDYKNIIKVVEVGSHVYVDDGLITLTVKEIGERANTLDCPPAGCPPTLADGSLVCVLQAATS